MHDWSDPAESGQILCARVRAKVIGCLTPGMLTVHIGPSSGLGGWLDLPLWLVPFHLRMPNTRLDMLFDVERREYVGALPWDGINTNPQFKVMSFEEEDHWREARQED